MDVPVSVIFFGRTGEGKSTLANMMIQADLCSDRSRNLFPIGDSAVGETSEVEFSQNNMFEVYDTIGLCETSEGTISHNKAIKKIRYYFSRLESPLNYICYVKKKGNTPEWAHANVKAIRKCFGNHPIIAVDFPFNDRYGVEIQQEIRKQNREHLINSLLYLRYNYVKLEILEYTTELESKVAKIVDFVPLVGTAYKLISSGVYFVLRKPNLAKRRLMEGTSDLSKILSKLAVKLLTKS
ncbi:16203_t:CDS:2 [Dentiscutata heterogama]|uniref:16203_t:CDS:1 n=1 Tax=Dentiscutata heterogama TaxID=1316150 RepID=A0ACA9KH62_9GLOM|nr:16203_t:CDS:2 [Dentiscutata heterogama]